MSAQLSNQRPSGRVTEELQLLIPVRQSDESRNNQRANIHNPTSPAHKAASNNRSNQVNPNNPAYRSSRQGNKK